MTKNYVTLAVVAVLALLIAFWVGTTRIAKAPVGNGQACTMEAKLCPDGSAVGRTGPNCEFAPCPTTTATSTLAIGESSTINGATINVLGLVGDSRCPVDVQCIQAGTVRVRASVNSSPSDSTFTLGQPQVVGYATITLASVTPAQRYSKQTIDPSEYRFTFTVLPEVAATSGVSGTISLGPTCPVERIPPDPACADKPYATAILVYRAGSSSLFILASSDTQGAFKFALPPGSYTLQAKGGATLPRCVPVNVIVPANGYVTTSISCDTGIR